MPTVAISDEMGTDVGENGLSAYSRLNFLREAQRTPGAKGLAGVLVSNVLFCHFSLLGSCLSPLSLPEHPYCYHDHVLSADFTPGFLLPLD